MQFSTCVQVIWACSWEKKNLCFKVFKHNQNMTRTQDYPLKSCAAAEIMSIVFNTFTLKLEEVSQSSEI